jgi:hypothetical protein
MKAVTLARKKRREENRERFLNARFISFFVQEVGMRHHLGKKVNARSIGSAVGLVVAAMAMPAHAANLLINPGFESPTDSSGNNTDTTATGWTFYGGDCVREAFATGNHTPGGEWGIWQETFQPAAGGIFQNVGGITDLTTYSLSTYYFFESAEPSVPGEVSDLALTFLNAGGSAVGPVDANGYSDATYIPSSSVTTTSAWIKYTVTGVAPTGATQVQVSFDFTGGSTVVGQQAAFVDDADLEGAGVPPTIAQWAVNGSGNWNSNGNWTTGSIPNAVDEEADFFGAITTSPQTIFTNSALTEGFLHFNNTNEYVIAGAPALTLQTSTGNAKVNVDQGTAELDLPVIVASNTVFTVAAGANLLVANPITINSGKTLTSTGGGTVTYQSIITVLGGGASIAFGNSTHANELSVASGSSASVGGTGTVLTLDTLANSGTLNLQNSELLINYGTGSDPIASVRAQLISGRAGGTWNGVGIDSSTAGLPANSHYALGYADGADHVVVGLSSGTIEVKYTLLGDADLDGVVTGSDFTALVGNLGKSGRVWDQGDFEYTGSVTGSDFTDLVSNLGKSSNGGSVVLPAADYVAIDAFAQANGLMADVPEPATGSMLLIAGAGMFMRRRRK